MGAIEGVMSPGICFPSLSRGDLLALALLARARKTAD